MSCLLGGDICAICMEGFNNEDDAAKLACGHVYHESCIRAWCDIKQSCPQCMRMIVDEYKKV